LVVFVSSTATGASLTGVIVIVNVWIALVSKPPLAVPPSSWIRTLTVAVPLAFSAEVYVSVPLAATAGWLLKRALLLFVTMKSTAWLDSLAGRALTAVAQPAAVCGPASSAFV